MFSKFRTSLITSLAFLMAAVVSITGSQAQNPPLPPPPPPTKPAQPVIRILAMDGCSPFWKFICLELWVWILFIRIPVTH